MLSISCLFVLETPSLHVTGTGRTALNVSKFKKGCRCVSEEACCTQTCMSADCNATQLKIMSLRYDKFVQACHEQHCNGVCVSRIVYPYFKLCTILGSLDLNFTQKLRLYSRVVNKLTKCNAAIK